MNTMFDFKFDVIELYTDPKRKVPSEYYQANMIKVTVRAVSHDQAIEIIDKALGAPRGGTYWSCKLKEVTFAEIKR